MYFVKYDHYYNRWISINLLCILNDFTASISPFFRYVELINCKSHFKPNVGMHYLNDDKSTVNKGPK